MKIQATTQPRFGIVYPDEATLHPVLYRGLIQRRNIGCFKKLDDQGYDVYVSVVGQESGRGNLRVALKNKIGKEIPNALLDLPKPIATYKRIAEVACELARYHREGPLRQPGDPPPLFNPSLTPVINNMFSCHRMGMPQGKPLDVLKLSQGLHPGNSFNR